MLIRIISQDGKIDIPYDFNVLLRWVIEQDMCYLFAYPFKKEMMNNVARYTLYKTKDREEFLAIRKFFYDYIITKGEYDTKIIDLSNGLWLEKYKEDEK